MNTISSLKCFSAMILLQFLVQSVQAQNVIKQADQQYKLLNYSKAIDLYEQAYRKKPTLHAAEQLASGYRMLKNYKEAESWDAIVLDIPGRSVHRIYHYAQALQRNHKYAEARLQYRNYALLNGQVSSDLRNKWLVSCDSAQYWMRNPAEIHLRNESSLNGDQSDWGAVAYNGGVVFASDRQIQENGGKNYLALYERKEGSTEVNRFPLQAKANHHLTAPCFSKDGKEIYFTLAAASAVNLEIYSAKKDEEGNWSVPIPFKYNKLAEYSVGDPFLTVDGSVLYFVSNMLGGRGGTDIYYCIKAEDGSWGEPVNVSSVNTEGNERSPFQDGSGQFYFSSEGHIGMGGLDIFCAKVTGNEFNGIRNMGYPINSSQDDFSYYLTEEGKGYFSSNRFEGKGSDEIYSFRPNEKLIVNLIGTVYKKGTTTLLKNAMISLKESSGSALTVQSGPDGLFNFNIEPGRIYSLTADKTGFQSNNATVNTIGFSDAGSIKKDIYLDSVVLKKEIELRDIGYNFDNPNVLLHSSMVLDNLVIMMKDNPTFWLELGLHIETKGNAISNLRFSQYKAGLIVQYLIDHGINKNRLIAKGYTAAFRSGLQRNETIRQLSQRIGFKILKF